MGCEMASDSNGRREKQNDVGYGHVVKQLVVRCEWRNIRGVVGHTPCLRSMKEAFTAVFITVCVSSERGV